MRTRVVTAALLCSVTCQIGRLTAQQATGSVIKQQLINLWESHYHRGDGLRTNRTYTFYSSVNGKPEAITQKDTISYAIKGQLKMLGFVSERYKGGSVFERYDELTITNAAYEAVLMRSKQDKDVWVLREFKSDKSSSPSPEVYRILACPWLLCANIAIPEWVSEPAFTIIKADALDGGITRVHFAYTGDKRPCPSGWLDIEMGRNGLIRGYEFNTKSKTAAGKEIGRYEYVTVDGKPVLKSREIQRPLMVSSSLGEYSSRETDEYDTVLGNPSDDEFYLPYYGIPEPAGVKREKAVPIYLWFLAGAFGCMAVMFGIRSRERLRLWFRRP